MSAYLTLYSIDGFEDQVVAVSDGACCKIIHATLVSNENYNIREWKLLELLARGIGQSCH